MNQREETNSIAILLKSDFFDIQDNLDNLDIETLEILEDLIFSVDIDNSLFKGIVIVKIYPEGDIKFTCKDPSKITKEDEKIIKDWLNDSESQVYSDGFFRLDLTNFIILFKIYEFNNNKMFVGHAIENSAISRINLLEAKQDYLLRNYA